MTALTADQLLNVLRASVDEAYLEPLENEDDGAGFDVYQSIATMLERASVAVDVSTQAMYIYLHSIQSSPPGSGGVQATGRLSITRASPTDGDVILLEGDLLIVQIVGPGGNVVDEFQVEVSADYIIAEGKNGPHAVYIRSVRVGYHGNVGASEGRSVAFLERITKTLSGITTTVANEITDSGVDDQFDDGDVNSWVRFTSGPNIGLGPRRIESFDEPTSTVVVGGPTLVAGAGACEVVSFVELGFTAEFLIDLTGGTSPMLDTSGAERDMGRGIGESDDVYRERLRSLPDTIAPNAIYRAVSRILTPIPVAFRVLESRHPIDFTGAAWGEFPYDDPEAYNWILGRQHLWQGNGFEYRGFYVVVERGWYGDFGAPFDQHPGGVHPSDAFDWMFYDGYPLDFYNDMENMIQEVNKTLGAGVPWLVVTVDTIP